MRLGIFGGTFDPPHIGHLIVAQDAALALRLDRVLVVPAAEPPHKRRQLTPSATRLEMTRAAVGGDPLFEVSDIELGRSGPSYTVDTLRELRQLRPADDLVLLIGEDQYREFGTWREPETVRELAEIAVLSRGGEGEAERQPPVAWEDAGVLRVHVTRIDVSSTDLRKRVGMGLPIRYMVDPAVATIIRNNRLYAETA